jgi:hypothetical protein
MPFSLYIQATCLLFIWRGEAGPGGLGRLLTGRRGVYLSLLLLPLFAGCFVQCIWALPSFLEYFSLHSRYLMEGWSVLFCACIAW